MLVAKLDLAQYIAVRSFAKFLGSKFQEFWRGVRRPQDGRFGGVSDKVDINGVKSKVEPVDGRMPNASGG